MTKPPPSPSYLTLKGGGEDPRSDPGGGPAASFPNLLEGGTLARRLRRHPLPCRGRDWRSLVPNYEAATPPPRATARGHAMAPHRRRFEQAIARGTYAAGDHLPGEMEIATRLGVNRHTVRHALSELTRRGLVRAERGSGTYVERKRLTYPIGARTRVPRRSSGTAAAARKAGSSLTRASRRRPISRSGSASRPARRWLVWGSCAVPTVSICSATSWLPATRAADAARVYRAHLSMTATLAHYGISDYRRQSTHISAATADATDAERLAAPRWTGGPHRRQHRCHGRWRPDPDHPRPLCRRPGRAGGGEITLSAALTSASA